jgi:hypothetical protein
MSARRASHHEIVFIVEEKTVAAFVILHKDRNSILATPKMAGHPDLDAMNTASIPLRDGRVEGQEIRANREHQSERNATSSRNSASIAPKSTRRRYRLSAAFGASTSAMRVLARLVLLSPIRKS